MAAIDTWEADIAAGSTDLELADQAHDDEPKPSAARSVHARVREAARAEAARTDASMTPAGDALRRWIRENPEESVRVYTEALNATKGDRLLGEIPDYAVRLRALDAILNRAEGMPVTRAELTGAGGGPITLAALLATDARDTE